MEDGEDDRVVMLSTKGYKAKLGAGDGRGLHWTTDINDELPVRMRPSGLGSERPRTMCEAFVDAVEREGDQPALHLQRDGQQFDWTWNEFFKDTMLFAKALANLNVTARSAVATMGYNAPEWLMAFLGAICYNTVTTGVYITNEPDACLYQATHASAEVVVCDSIERLRRFTVNLDKLPKVKAFVVWGVHSLPEEFNGPRFFLWKDFLATGTHIADSVIKEKMREQTPGMCCNLSYTSGTTGNPKGVMLSHDNLVWGSNSMLH